MNKTILFKIKGIDNIKPAFKSINNELKYSSKTFSKLQIDLKNLNRELKKLNNNSFKNNVPKTPIIPPLKTPIIPPLKTPIVPPLKTPIVPPSKKGIKQQLPSAFGITNGLMGLAAGGYAVKKLLDSFREYEVAYKGVKKSADGTDAEYNLVRSQLKNISGVGFIEAASIATEGAKMNIALKKLPEFGKTIGKVAVALDFNSSEAVDSMSKILQKGNMLKDPIKNTEIVADKVVHLENKLAGVKAADLFNVTARNMDYYQDLEMSLDEKFGLSAYLIQSNVSRELAASAFGMLIRKLKLKDPKALKDLRKKGFTKGFFELVQKLKGMDKNYVLGKDADNIQSKAYKDYGIAMKLVDKMLKKFNREQLKKNIKIASKSKGALGREWAVHIDSYDAKASDFTYKLKNLMDSIGYIFSIGASKILYFINPILGGVSNWIDENRGLVASIVRVSVAIGTVALALKGLGLLKVLAVASYGKIVGFVTGVVKLLKGIVTVLKVIRGITITTTLAAYLNPANLGMAAIAVVVTAIGAGVLYLCNGFDDFKMILGTVASYMKAIVMPVFNFFYQLLCDISNILGNIVSTILKYTGLKFVSDITGVTSLINSVTNTLTNPEKSDKDKLEITLKTDKGVSASVSSGLFNNNRFSFKNESLNGVS